MVGSRCNLQPPLSRTDFFNGIDHKPSSSFGWCYPASQAAYEGSIPFARSSLLRASGALRAYELRQNAISKSTTEITRFGMIYFSPVLPTMKDT